MAIAVEDLPDLIPGILSEMFGEDSYCTLSRFKKPPERGTTPPGWAAKRNVSHLTAAWVDIDGREAPGGALDVVQVLNDVNRLIAAKRIPRPSIMVESGRGVWLFWRIHPVELATRLAVDTLTRINRRAAELLNALGADRKAASVNSWTRVPGSINTKSGREVLWHVVLQGEAREPIQYTLAELAAAFGVSEHPAPSVFTSLHDRIEPAGMIAPGREKNPARVKGGVNGNKARTNNLIAALSHLASIRGGFRKGMRNHACHFLAVHLYRSGRSLAEIYRILSDPGLFTPSLTDSETRKHVAAAPRFQKNVKRSGGGFAPISFQYMADILKVSPDESRAIADCIGVSFPYIFQNQQPAPVALSSAERRQARRERVQQLATETPGISERAILAVLISEGVQVSTFTVHSDLVALGLNRPGPVPAPDPEPPPALPFE
jgi:hypothetical protein